MSQTILLTGAAGGIGREIAKQLATKERRLVALDKDQEGLHTLHGDISNKYLEFRSVILDLNDPMALNAWASLEVDNGLIVDVLINNAGFAHPLMPLEDISSAEFDLTMNVNLKAPFLLTKMFLPKMRERDNGLIINVSSAANIWGYKNHSLYAASKAALSSFTESTALEVSGTDIVAVSVLPSRTDTQMNFELRGDSGAEPQPASYVGKVIAGIVNNEIKVSNGDDIRIKDSQHTVEQHLPSKPV